MTDNDIKYKAIFGDMAQFNGMMPDCEFVDGTYGYKRVGDKFYYCERHNEKYGWSVSQKVSIDFRPIAMRSIIKEPKHWTWEDKKVGRLPEVGSLIVNVETGDQFSFVGVNAGSNRWACKDACDGLLYFFKSHEMSPIETPEEKAERLRSEWCSECTSKYYPRGHKGFPEMIYDALLSGALSVPTKGDE